MLGRMANDTDLKGIVVSSLGRQPTGAIPVDGGYSANESATIMMLTQRRPAIIAVFTYYVPWLKTNQTKIRTTISELCFLGKIFFKRRLCVTGGAQAGSVHLWPRSPLAGFAYPGLLCCSPCRQYDISRDSVLQAPNANFYTLNKTSVYSVFSITPATQKQKFVSFRVFRGLKK